MKKWFFRSNSPFITYLFLFFTGRTNAQKLTSRGPDQMMGRRDVRGTSVKHVFLNSTHKRIKLTLTGYSRLYSEW